MVVGLGPAGADLLLPVARRALEDAAVRYARTARHPAVVELAAEGLELTPLDAHYESAEDLDAAYRGIVGELVEAARRHGTVAYAVPGNPAVAERTVEMLAEAGVEIEVVPGLSFADLAWARLGGPGWIADGRSIDRADLLSGGRMLVSQCDSPAVLSDVKLLLLEELPADAPVTVLQRLGLPDERIEVVALADLDRVVEPDHLTSVFVDLGVGPTEEFARFVALVERLRAPGGCPWDAEQTHHSLTRHLIEEAYETVEAIESLPPDAPAGPVEPGAYARVADELGDLAAQVVFHATLAREAGAFTMREVLRGIREKLIRRHPHVFGEVEVSGADEVVTNWEQIKRREREEAGEASTFMADVPPGLPSLLYAHKLFRKASSAGLAPMDEGEAARALARDAARLPEVEGAEAEALVGELLATVTLVARAKGFDAESALRAWAGRFRARFLAFEQLAGERGLDVTALSPAEVGALWLETALGNR